MSLAGIDVSHFNGLIDWRAAASSASFAFSKATQGNTYIDPRFAQNWKGMRDAGLPRGAYHFYDPSLDAETQALHFLKTVPLQKNDLPPVLDIEMQNGATAASTLAGIGTWLAIVALVTKRKPIVYTSAYFWNKLGNPSSLGEYPLWVAHHKAPAPALPEAWNRWTFWQFTQLGRCSGIQGYVDLNRFSGSLTDLRGLSLIGRT